MSDPYIAAIAAKERAKGRVYVHKVCNEWRREVGMPSRQVEAWREAQASAEEIGKAMTRAAHAARRIFNPGAPDGRNNWEDLPPLGPTPIFDAMARELGAPL